MGPQGEQGTKGEQGERGKRGQRGPAGSRGAAGGGEFSLTDELDRHTTHALKELSEALPLTIIPLTLSLACYGNP